MSWMSYTGLVRIQRDFERQLEEEKTKQTEERQRHMYMVMSRFKDTELR